MTAYLGTIRLIPVAIFNCTVRCKGALLALLFVLPLLGVQAHAQTTTISGTVYDPRPGAFDPVTKTGALPLPNVLVYVTTGAVAPLPSGVQCLTTSDPTGVVGFTYTAADGTFTIGNVPVNASYTIVIQAGKWRRQFTQAVVTDPIVGLALHMPSDHTQGDIPRIAIATGSVDALECVLRDMGIADTEFTDDNGTVNPGGRVHLYKGVYSPGADINASTPSESVLMGTPTDSTVLDSYDLVMFPCQGSPHTQTATALTSLVNYANTGGRVFTTHYSYDRLDPNSPYNAQFPPVVNWMPGQNNPVPDPGIATVNTGFNDGATLSQWLDNAGASFNNTPGQVQISTLRHDFNGVIAPTQPWLTLNNPATGNPVMQFTFNTPVAAPAANQCGRVLFNEYHVFNAGGTTGSVFPAECPASTAMSAQAKMLEYALFDLSTFVTPVVVPTLSIGFNPSPMIVKQGDTADTVTINVTNTSASTQINSTVVLTFTVPTGLTVTALADASGGWKCTLATLTCTRSTSIGASASDSVMLTASVQPYGPGAAGSIVVTASSPNFSSNVTASDTVIFQQPPAITWPTPANIVYGTALSGTQLNASSPVAGSFSYIPSAGTVLAVGPHTLTVSFSPTDTVDYTTSSASVILTVIPATPALSLTSNANPVFMSNSVTFTATITSLAVQPTGTITFWDGTTQLGSGTVTNGVATITISSLSNQIHSITAVYSGDTSYGPASSGALSEKVVDFTVAPAGSGALTVAAAGVASFPLVITPVGGSTLPGAMTLSVVGLSVDSTASFSPATVTAGAGTTTVTLLVQLPGKAALQSPARPFSGGALPLALSLILLPFAGRLRKAARQWRRLAVLAILGAALAVGLNGCGSNGKLNPQGYSLTVTAASGPLSHSASLKLTVQ